MTARQLLNLCQSDKVSKQSICYGYTMGLTEAGIVNEDLCMDIGITHARTMKESIEHMKANPDLLHEPAALMLLDVLRSVHPCEHSEH